MISETMVLSSWSYVNFLEFGLIMSLVSIFCMVLLVYYYRGLAIKYEHMASKYRDMYHSLRDQHELSDDDQAKMRLGELIIEGYNQFLRN